MEEQAARNTITSALDPLLQVILAFNCILALYYVFLI